MFDDVVELINLFVVPNYDGIIKCKSIVYIESGFGSTLNGKALVITFGKEIFSTVNMNELRDDVKCLFKMLDRCNDEYYDSFYWINYEYIRQFRDI